MRARPLLLAAAIAASLGAGERASAQTEPLHPSLAEVHLLEEGPPSIEGPDHVKVVEKDGRLALEGATSVVEASLALGAWQLGHGNLEQAMKVVEAGLKEASDEPRLLAIASAIALELGDTDRALRLAEDGLGGDARHALLHFVKGRALESAGRPEEGVASLEEAARLAPNVPAYRASLGRLAYENGALDTAIRAFEAARTAARTSDGALVPTVNLALSFLAAGRAEEARSLCREIEPDDGDPKAARALANRGAIQLRAEAWEEAEAAYGRALTLDAATPGAAYNQAYLFYRRGELDAARQGYEKALALTPDLPLAYLHVAEIDFRRGEAASAVEWLERGEPYFDTASRPRVWTLRGDSLEALGDLDGAAGAYREALELTPGELATQTALASVLRLSGDLAGARDVLESARAQAPAETRVLLELAALARAEGDTEAEKASYLDILAKEGDTADTWVVQLNLALLLLREGETVEARERLEPLLARAAASSDSDGLVSSDQARVLATTYGMLLAKEGSFDAATERFTAVTDSSESASASFGPALQGLAVVAALGGDLEGARARLAQLQASSQEASPLAAGNLGLVLWLDGKGDEARVHLETAVGAYPGWTSARAALAAVELGSGRYPAALEQAEEAHRLCTEDARERPFGQGLPPNWLGVTLGGAEGLCAFVARELGSALVGVSLAALGDDPPRGPRISSYMERALDLPLQPRDEARARFVRGTLSLLAGDYEKARGDLERALGGEIDANLRALAENNLGVALHGLGRTAEAEQRFLAASASAASRLNLGIVLDERNDNGEAIRLYEEYLASSSQTPRRSEILEWIDNLKRVSQ